LLGKAALGPSFAGVAVTLEYQSERDALIAYNPTPYAHYLCRSEILHAFGHLDQDIRMTRAETIRIDLTEQILSGHRLPGSPLDEHELAQTYGASRTPVREALRQLASSGLVAHRPHRGAVVAAPTPRMLQDMFQVMADLEGLCAQHSARQMTASERDALKRTHEDMAPVVRSGDPMAYAIANEGFHALIYAGSHNVYLADLTLQTRQRLKPFRSAQFNTIGRLSASHSEHENIVQAILRGDQAGAQSTMVGHITVVRDAYLSLAHVAEKPPLSARA
jgi:DNA-binding GntR family transcriptional regulator